MSSYFSIRKLQNQVTASPFLGLITIWTSWTPGMQVCAARPLVAVLRETPDRAVRLAAAEDAVAWVSFGSLVDDVAGLVVDGECHAFDARTVGLAGSGDRTPRPGTQSCSRNTIGVGDFVRCKAWLAGVGCVPVFTPRLLPKSLLPSLPSTGTTATCAVVLVGRKGGVWPSARASVWAAAHRPAAMRDPDYTPRIAAPAPTQPWVTVRDDLDLDPLPAREAVCHERQRPKLLVLRASAASGGLYTVPGRVAGSGPLVITRQLAAGGAPVSAVHPPWLYLHSVSPRLRSEPGGVR